MINLSNIIIWVFIFLQCQTNPTLKMHRIPLHGNASLGYYYANIYIGNPSQEQSVIVDTGSGQLALPCSKCTDCGSSHLQRPFEMTQSSTSKYVTC